MSTTAPDAVLGDNRVELACVELGGQLFGIDVGQVREIVFCPEVTPLPRAPALIEGVIDLRGVVLPVVDLARALDAPPTPAEKARVAVLEVEGLRFGLRVAAAVDVLSLPARSVDEPPPLATQAGYEVVRAVVRREDRAPVLVLSLEHLIECVYRSGLPVAGEGS